MKILIDTNVILDHFLERKPFSHAATLIFAATEQGKLETYIGATTVTTVHYLVTKYLGKKDGTSVIERLLRLFEIDDPCYVCSYGFWRNPGRNHYSKRPMHNFKK